MVEHYLLAALLLVITAGALDAFWVWGREISDAVRD